MISIVLADDHDIVRRGLRTLLEGEADFSIVAEASDGLDALQRVTTLQPRILVVDLMMPKLSGLDVARQCAEAARQTAIIILSMYAETPYVLEALRAGVLGYVLKDSSASDLIAAVRSAVDGQYYLSPPLSDIGVDELLRQARQTPSSPFEQLSSREREVLRLAAEGHSSAAIGDMLCISRRTVESHRANLMAKLNLKTQSDLVRLALREGIIR
jgi:DNA-binding NarL/FixJ family response regulator